MAIKVGINGFGRIGRNFYRAVRGDADIDIVALNDITDPPTLAHLLKYDSVLGALDSDVEAVEGGLSVDGKRIQVSSERDPARIDWPGSGVDLVVESTGFFATGEAAAKARAGFSTEGYYFGARKGRRHYDLCWCERRQVR